MVINMYLFIRNILAIGRPILYRKLAIESIDATVDCLQSSIIIDPIESGCPFGCAKFQN